MTPRPSTTKDPNATEAEGRNANMSENACISEASDKMLDYWHDKLRPLGSPAPDRDTAISFILRAKLERDKNRQTTNMSETGTGTSNDAPVCAACGNTGYDPHGFGLPRRQRGRTCPKCNGTGRAAPNKEAGMSETTEKELDPASGEAAPGEARRGTARAEERVVQEAYGLLWQVETHDARVHQARRLLLSLTDKEGRRKGISNTRPLDCGHPISLGLISAEIGEFLFCEMCDTRSERDDAVRMEEQYKAERDALATELAEAKEEIARAKVAADADVDRLRGVADDEFVNAAIRVMCANPGFDSRDYSDGITADDFEEFFKEDMREAWLQVETLQARLSALQSELIAGRLT